MYMMLSKSLEVTPKACNEDQTQEWEAQGESTGPITISCQLERLLCGGSRCVCRVSQYDIHEAETIGTHGNVTDVCYIAYRSLEIAEPAANGVLRRPAWGELACCLFETAIAEINGRPGNQLSAFALGAAAAAALGGIGHVQTSGCSASKSRKDAHGTSGCRP